MQAQVRRGTEPASGGDLGRDQRAVVATDQVEAQVDPGCDPRAGGHRSVVEVQHVGIDVDARVASGELVSPSTARQRRRRLVRMAPDPAPRRATRQIGIVLSCLSSDGGAVTAAKGLVLGAHHAFDAAPPLDVLLHPGGHGKEKLLGDAAYLDWVRGQRAAVPLMTSVCTGALVYAAGGLLSGRRATTHWAFLDRLRELEPTVDAQAHARYVDDGDLITSAGVSAGIDMALHLVARLAGADRARQVRHAIQYGPAALV